MNKFLNFNLNIKLQKISRYFYLLTVVIILILLFFATKFLYDKFYLSITQSREVIVLKEKIAPETIDLSAFESILNNIKTKTERKNSEINSNPFE
jgi:uncharacterized membrane protein